MNDYEREHSAALRQSGAECTVLLRSNGRFPLAAPCQIALYGSGARRTIKGGTGSGEVNSRYFVTAEKGLEDAGFSISTKSWMDAYDNISIAAHRDFIHDLKKQAKEHHTLAVIESMGAVMPEPEYNIPLNVTGDTAIYVLARISGEGSDRRPIPGDILLTETEKRDILFLNQEYKNFMLVLNVGGVVDLTPVAEVGNILLMSQLGVESGSILADILLGKSYPSGKLTTSWATWEDYSKIGSFGDREDTRYNEGVYVGYRYFDSIGKKPLFPFGFGLGYTQFAWETAETKRSGETVCVSARVKNTGAFAGKEVLQLYVSQPQGKLDKPFQTLAAFQKTRELAPGESETLSLLFNLRDMASYDENSAEWILEKGDYILRVGVSSTDTKPAAIVHLAQDAVTLKARNCLGKPDFTDWRPAAKAFETYSDLTVLQVAGEDIETRSVCYELEHEIDPIIDGLPDEDLARMNLGMFSSGLGSLMMIGSSSKLVAGAAGETSDCLKAKGIPALVMADGPAGLRLSRQFTVDKKGVHPVGETMPESIVELLPDPVAWFIRRMSSGKRSSGTIYEQNCTAIPVGTALAQSWNLDFAEACGDMVGDEMERFGIHLWLAPALNIHRSIRCGRNYEYFSEDPFLSGKFAAAVTRGVQRHPGRGTTIKHFAANNQELNRVNNNSLVSERAMREIYLRGFGIAVKESQPYALMTSYNLINGIHTSERRDLIEDILRAEFGYQGIVMTDWIISAGAEKAPKYHAPVSAKIAAAGNDLTMPGSKGDLKAMLKGMKDGTVSRRQLKVNATRVSLMAKKLCRQHRKDC